MKPWGALIVDSEVWHGPQSFFSPEDLPVSLMDLISLICTDYGTEILATANLYHAWLEEEYRPSGTIISHDQVKANHQILGSVAHEQQGVTINRMALIDNLTQHQRFVNVIDGMSEPDRSLFEKLMEKNGGTAIATLRLRRTMKRKNFRIHSSLKLHKCLFVSKLSISSISANTKVGP